MLHRLARATAVAALLALPASADAAKKPELTVTGSLSTTSTLTSVCQKPGYGKDVVVTEKVITIRTYTFSGDSGTPKSPGRMTSKGEEIYETDSKVAGETDLLADQHVGPITKVIPGSTTTWNTTFRRTTEGEGRNRQEVLGFDMTGLAGSSRSGTIPMPRRGRTVEHFLEPRTRKQPDRKTADCTYSDESFTSGFINVTRR